MEDRHHLTFDTYEEGKLTLDEYLSRVVFYRQRTFSRAQFRKFMFAQSKPFPEMIGLIRRLKSDVYKRQALGRGRFQLARRRAAGAAAVAENQKLRLLAHRADGAAGGALRPRA